MSHTLTRRNISAIAKLDFAGQSHAQRLEAIAKALGYDTAAALMSTIKSSEMAETAPTEEPIRIVYAFGSHAAHCMADNEEMKDEYGHVDGAIVEKTFKTKAEADAYDQGVADMDGWMSVHGMSTLDDPNNPYWAALAANPTLDYEDWHDAEVKRIAAEEEAEFEDEDEGDA